MKTSSCRKIYFERSFSTLKKGKKGKNKKLQKKYKKTKTNFTKNYLKKIKK